MPNLGATEGLVSEPQGKLTVTKRYFESTKEGTKEGQSDQRTILDSEGGPGSTYGTLILKTRGILFLSLI